MRFYAYGPGRESVTGPRGSPLDPYGSPLAQKQGIPMHFYAYGTGQESVEGP